MSPINSFNLISLLQSPGGPSVSKGFDIGKRLINCRNNLALGTRLFYKKNTFFPEAQFS